MIYIPLNGVNISLMNGTLDFLTDIIDLNPEIALEAFKEMVANKKNPELDEYEVLDQLRNNGLVDTANYLHALI